MSLQTTYDTATTIIASGQSRQSISGISYLELGTLTSFAFFEAERTQYIIVLSTLAG